MYIKINCVIGIDCKINMKKMNIKEKNTQYISLSRWLPCQHTIFTIAITHIIIIRANVTFQ